MANGLQNLTLHPSTTQWMGAGFLVCGKSNDQVVEETVADYLNQTAQPGETVRERQIKRNVFIDGIQSGVFFFLPPGTSMLPPLSAWSTPSFTMDKTRAYRDTRSPYLENKLTKLLIKILLDKFPLHSIIKNMIYIYKKIIHIHIQSYAYLCKYVEKPIPITNKLVSFANGCKQMLLVLN